MNRYETYKPSGIDWIGEVPEVWKIKRIKRIAEILRGASPRPIDDEKYFDDNGEFSWVRISDVTASETYLNETYEKLSELGSSLSVKIKPGDLFVSIAGSVGKPIISNIKACIHDGFVWLKSPKVDTKYLYYILNADGIYGGLGKLGTQLNLNTQILGSVIIPIPSKTEQLTIANYLDDQTQKIDRLIANKKTQAEKLKELRQIEINNAVTKRLNPNAEMKDSGIEWLGDIPKHCEVNRLKNSTFINQSVISEKTSPDYLIKYIDISNVNSMGEFIELQEMEFSEAPSRARRVPKHNSILLSTVRTYLRAIALVQNPDENLIASTGFAVIDANQNLFDAGYLYFQMISHILVERVIANSEGVSYPAISSTKLGDIKIVIPPKKEQAEIANFLQKRTTAIDQLIKNIEAQIDKLQELRKIKIYEAVTGKIKVNAYAETTA